MKHVLFMASLLVSSNALAASGGQGVPSAVWYQVLNFGLYAALLFFVLRKPLVTFFRTRAENFHQARIKAESAKAKAEEQKREIEQRLAKLQNSADESIAKAKAEAEELRHRIIAEAQELSSMLKTDAQRTAQAEIQRARTELREEMLNQAIVSAKTILNEKIVESDQKRFQSEFVEKIQVVRQ